jgi:hypothetical protein
MAEGEEARVRPDLLANRTQRLRAAVHEDDVAALQRRAEGRVVVAGPRFDVRASGEFGAFFQDRFEKGRNQPIASVLYRHAGFGAEREDEGRQRHAQRRIARDERRPLHASIVHGRPARTLDETVEPRERAQLVFDHRAQRRAGDAFEEPVERVVDDRLAVVRARHGGLQGAHAGREIGVAPALGRVGQRFEDARCGQRAAHAPARSSSASSEQPRAGASSSRPSNTMPPLAA